METTATPRLVIRPFADADLADFLAYHAHPAARAYLPGEPMAEAQAVRFLAKQAALVGCEKELYHAFAVWHQADKKVIGEVGFFLGQDSDGKADIGFMFHPDYYGQSYAREAAEVLLEYAFQTCGLRRVTAMCDTRNAASFRLMERLGMRCEGHFLQSKQMHGAWHDEFSYALLRDEWVSRFEPKRVSGQ